VSWRGIVEFRLVASDLDRAMRFYATLGFSPRARVRVTRDEMTLLGLAGGGTRQTLIRGPSRLAIDCFDAPGRPFQADANAADILFQHLALVTDNVDKSWARASAAGAATISRAGPVKLPPSTGGMTAVKFRDPDGHPLELVQFPMGAATSWAGSGLLGIDHSAVSVADVAVSRRFYRSQGLTECRPSLNHGPTQEALDGLDGVEVDVVPLDPAENPPHLELLGYRSPRGRSFGVIAPNDIAATRMLWKADRRALVRDPDGHLHQLEP